MTPPSSSEPEASANTVQDGGYGLSLLLTALAGSVDAVGFVHWHGLFVSFMSGNSTILGTALAGADWARALTSLAVIVGFVCGVSLGELLDGIAGAQARAAILLCEAALLGAGALAAFFGSDERVAAPLLSIAMGVQNGSVHRAAGISVALTYVTGTLVHIGRGIAKAARKDGPGSATLPFLGLWCALVGGSTVGALAAARSDWGALAGASVASLLLAIAVVVMAWSRSRSNPGAARA